MKVEQFFHAHSFKENEMKNYDTCSLMQSKQKKNRIRTSDHDKNLNKIFS